MQQEYELCLIDLAIPFGEFAPKNYIILITFYKTEKREEIKTNIPSTPDNRMQAISYASNHLIQLGWTPVKQISAFGPNIFRRPLKHTNPKEP